MRNRRPTLVETRLWCSVNLATRSEWLEYFIDVGPAIIIPFQLRDGGRRIQSIRQVWQSARPSGKAEFRRLHALCGLGGHTRAAVGPMTFLLSC